MNDEGSPARRFAAPVRRTRLAQALLICVPVLGASCTKSEPPTPQATVTEPAGKAPAKNVSKAAAGAPQLPATYRLDLGSAPPAGTVAVGWTPARDDGGRRVLNLADSEASLRFGLTRAAGDYMLTGVARVDDTDKTALRPSLGGKPLAVWTLSSDWQMFASPVPPDALKDSSSEIGFASDADDEAIAIGALALVPLADRVSVQIGAETMGLLIDGFHDIEKGGLRWSKGKTSTWGAVMKPGPGPHRLLIRGSAFRPIAPVIVEASVNGQKVGAGSFEAEFGDVTWDIPAGTLSSGLNRVELSYGKTGKPSDQGKSKDTREIAVRFERLEIVPAR